MVEQAQQDRLQQTCKVCGRPDKFNFNVPDDVWELVVPEQFQNRVVCLSCFDDFAHSKLVAYAEYLESLLFVGIETSFTLAITSRDEANG